MKQYRFVGASIFFCMLLALSSSWAQHTFMKNYSFDYAVSSARIAQSARSAIDTSIVLCGYTQTDALGGIVCKIDQNGSVGWSYRVSWGNSNFYLLGIQVLADGSIVIAGNESMNGSPTMLKLDRDGHLLWCHKYNIGASIYSSSICQSKDGGFIVVGHYGTNSFVLKADSAGTLLWSHTMTPIVERVLEAGFERIIECPDATLIAVGFIRSAPTDGSFKQQLGIIHLTLTGDIIEAWAYPIPGTQLSSSSLVQLPDGSMVVAIGTTTISETQSIVLRFALAGDIIWNKTIGTLSNAIVISIIQDGNNELIGSMMSLNGGPGAPIDRYLFKMKTDGILIDALKYTSDFSSYSDQLLRLPASVGQNYLILSGGGPAIATISDSLAACTTTPSFYTDNDLLLKKTTLLLDTASPTMKDIAIELSQSSMPITTSLMCGEELDGVEAMYNSNDLLLLSPNPVSDHSVVTLTAPLSVHGAVEVYVRDLTGRTVYHSSARFDEARREVQLPTSSLASGLYYIDLLDETTFSRLWHGKMIVE